MEKQEFAKITRQKQIEEGEFRKLLDGMYEQLWENLFPPQILTDGLSVKVENNVITPENALIPDCITCGACCALLLCVNLNPRNAVAPDDYWEITKQGDNRELTVDRCMKLKEEDFSCTALDGTVGEEVTCLIYEDRPKMCRTFEAGSDRCHAVRRAVGIEPFLGLMEMYEAVQKLKSQKENPDELEKIEIVNIYEEGESKNLQIKVILKNKMEKVIHNFDPKLETWFQAEFEGLTLAKADELISTR